MNIKTATCLLALFLSAKINGQSLCWEISGNKLKQSSFLYGTMHSADKRVFNLSESCKKAFESAEVYTMEIDPAKINALSLLSEIMGDGKHSLKKELSPDGYNLLDSTVNAKTGLSLSLFDKMQPIIIQALISMPDGDKTKDSSGLFLDLYFYKMAQEKGKKITGVETVNEQIKALNTLNYQDQITLLLKDLKEQKDSKDDFENMMRQYVNASLDSLLMMSDELQMPAQFNKVLLTDRNLRMADRISKMIAKESHFIGIGAMHLPGTEGVIELLRKKGFTVKPIK